MPVYRISVPHIRGQVRVQSYLRISPASVACTLEYVCMLLYSYSMLLYTTINYCTPVPLSPSVFHCSNSAAV